MPDHERPGVATLPVQHGAPPRSMISSWILRLATAAALAMDAAVHAGSASAYDSVGTTLSQGTLFRVEAGVACAAALLVLIWPHRTSWIIAFLVSASALGAVLLYRYVDVGSLGPLPDMYENTWKVPGKLFSAYAEGAAVVLSALGLMVHWRWHPSEHRGGVL
jgi:hypothetical protein